MIFDSQWLRGAGPLALILIAGVCGKKTDSGGDAGVPEVSADVPEIAADNKRMDADSRELSRYQLTMANVRKWAVAQEKLKKLEAEHPELADEDDEDSSGELWLDKFEARVERVPAARKIIQDAGLDVREFALIAYTLLQAWGGQMQIKTGANQDSLARENGIHPANLRFAKQHEAELAKLMKSFITN